MKLIIAIVRPEKLADVKRALFQVGVTGMTLSRVSGHGGERDVVQQYRGDKVVLEFHEKVRIEMACSEAFVERTIQAICEGARTGDVGDGKIFVMPLDRTVRIRTGERDDQALTAVNADEIMRMTQLEMPIPRLEDL
ncbi:MAG: P-II family nitrogen regulator [Gemmatimonas sp.]